MSSTDGSTYYTVGQFVSLATLFCTGLFSDTSSDIPIEFYGSKPVKRVPTLLVSLFRLLKAVMFRQLFILPFSGGCS